jgi:NADH-quinone oxidoreductase subunit J
VLVQLAFWIFATILVASAVMVVTARNPVHSVLFLILSFFNAAGLFLLTGAEFLAMILVIVYVGAVAVLFLFVVMMLDVDFAQLREGFQRYAPIGALVGIVLLVELVVVVTAWHAAPEAMRLTVAPRPEPSAVTNADALGQVLYTQYVFLFQASGMVLLVAMIGAIVLTLRTRPGLRRQSIAAQLARTRADTLVMTHVAVGSAMTRVAPLPAPEPEPVHGDAHGGHHGHGGHH